MTPIGCSARVLGVLVLVVALVGCRSGGSAERPNIVLILADDLGSGDVGAYNPDSKVPTPWMDGLAWDGVRFTDAHSPSAVCTPTRYALLTGRYAWRTRQKNWVLNGYGRALIEPGRPTIASALGEAGYATACVGKWHLGLGSYDPARPVARTDYESAVEAALDAGPHTVGFERSLIIPASLDMPPYVWVEDGVLTEAPTATTPGSARRWSGGGGFWRAGPMGPSFSFEGVLPTIAERAAVDVAELARADRPFFLYVPLAAPHTPWVPTEFFRGSSEAGWYGDFVAQVDDAVGQILDAIEDAGVADSTIVIVTSDNGSHWRERDETEFGHLANLDYRGMKADIHEGGHRVPLIVRWPGRSDPGSVSGATVGLHDLYATLASAAGLEPGPGEAPDSVGFGRAIRGGGHNRPPIVHHSGDGMFAVRSGRWKLIEGLGSGGFTKPARADPGEGSPGVQLYDLEAGPGETNNLAATHPGVVARLMADLRAVRDSELARP